MTAEHDSDVSKGDLVPLSGDPVTGEREALLESIDLSASFDPVPSARLDELDEMLERAAELDDMPGF